MNATNTIRELAEATLLANQGFAGVEFIDRLLLLAHEFGEIKCSLANDRTLRFQANSFPSCDVEMDLAKAKLRMLCARLSVLCNESGGQDVSLYGGEGVIEKASASLPVSATSDHERMAREPDESNNRIPASLPSLLDRSTDLDRLTWKVRFKNTMHEQEFTISRLSD